MDSFDWIPPPTADPRFYATTQALVAQLGGRAVVPPGDALAAVLGDNMLDADYAAARRLARGKYPWPTILVGARRLVLVADVAATLCGLSPLTVTPVPERESEKARRGAGRPRITAAAGEDGDHA